MIGFFGTLAAFLAAAALADELLRGARGQSGLAAIVLVHGLGGAVWCVLATLSGVATVGSVLLFWGGGFLVWLGIRLHLESSILLRLAHFLAHDGPQPEAELLARCEARYGIEARIDELARGGFVRRRGDAVELLGKGRFVARVVALLEGP